MKKTPLVLSTHISRDLTHLVSCDGSAIRFWSLPAIAAAPA